MFARLYWILPVFAALVWLGTLLGLLLHWVVIGEPHYPSMEANQHIAYISDVGAEKLKPLFIAGAAVTVVCLDISMIAERWLRHKGRLAPNTSWWQKGFSIISIIAAIVGAAGIILLSIFDTLRHPHLHDDFLAVFIVGYVVSAIFICAEYQRLGTHFHEQRVLRASFWLKLAFIIIEIALAIPFGILHTKKTNINAAAILEWVIALVFTGYVLSFAMDLLPAIRTKHHKSGETVTEMAHNNEAGYTNGDNSLTSDYMAADESNGGYRGGGYGGARTPPLTATRY